MDGVKQEAAVVLFDGCCNLCNSFVNLLMRADWRGRLRFAALQGETGKRLAQEAGLDTGRVDTLVLIEGGEYYLRSEALLRALSSAGFPWSLAGACRIIPRRWRDRLYGLVARNRYRLFGRRRTCRTPGPDEDGRFIG